MEMMDRYMDKVRDRGLGTTASQRVYLYRCSNKISDPISRQAGRKKRRKRSDTRERVEIKNDSERPQHSQDMICQRSTYAHTQTGFPPSLQKAVTHTPSLDRPSPPQSYSEKSLANILFFSPESISSTTCPDVYASHALHTSATTGGSTLCLNSPVCSIVLMYNPPLTCHAMWQ